MLTLFVSRLCPCFLRFPQHVLRLLLWLSPPQFSCTGKPLAVGCSCRGKFLAAGIFLLWEFSVGRLTPSAVLACSLTPLPRSALSFRSRLVRPSVPPSGGLHEPR